MTRRSPRSAAVLLDLDGTVWDSRPGIVDCLAATLDELGLTVPEPAALATCVGPPLDRTLSQLGVGDERLDRAVDIYRHHYSGGGEDSVTLFEGALAMLDGIRDLGHPLITATSKGVEPVRRLLDRLDIADRFDAVAAAPMRGPGAEKIDVVAVALDLAARLDGAAQRSTAVMVGDRAADIEAAHHHRLRSIAVRWGYASPGELEELHPERWATEPAEVVTHLRDDAAGFSVPGDDR